MNQRTRMLLLYICNNIYLRNSITPRNASTPEEPPYIGHFCGNFNPIQGNERQKRTCARDSENRNEERKMKTKGKTKEKRVSVGVPLPPRKNIKTSMNRKKPLYPIQGFHPRISPTAPDTIAGNPVSPVALVGATFPRDTPHQ